MNDHIEEQGLDNIHHVAMQVNDIQAAIDWYASRFRTVVEYQDASWALLRFQNIGLALVKPEQHPPHIAFEHPHAEEFGSLTRHRDGSRTVYIQDRDDNIIEIVQRSDRFSAG